MSKRLGFVFLLWLSAESFFSSCASIQTPVGGEKDTVPPVLLSSVPAHLSRGYRGQMIRLEFSEYINTQDLKKELIITPQPPGEMSFRQKAQTLILRFDKPLRDSTTYTFNFRNAIKDITERNPAKNLLLTFSTGPNLDSFSIRGEVRHALFLNIPKNMSVMLYPEDDTLDFGKHRPPYLTKTDEKGQFIFPNLPAKAFRIYALSGESPFYTRREQLVGFWHAPVNPDSMPFLPLRVLDYDLKPFIFIRHKPLGRYYEAQFNKTPLTFLPKFEPQYDSLVSFSIDKSRVLFFPLGTLSDSLYCKFIASDSSGNVLDTAFYLRFDAKAKLRKEKWTVSYTHRPDVDPEDSIVLELRFNKPIAKFLSDSAKWTSESDSVAKPLQYAFTRRKTAILFPLGRIREKNSLKFAKGTFISIDSDTLATQSFSFYPRKESDYGIISGKILTRLPSYFLQVLNEKNEVEAQLSHPKEFRFEFLLPGKKRLRVLIDANLDGKWDAGDAKLRRPPEPVFILQKELNLKANWELADNIITF